MKSYKIRVFFKKKKFKKFKGELEAPQISPGIFEPEAPITEKFEPVESPKPRFEDTNILSMGELINYQDEFKQWLKDNNIFQRADYQRWFDSQPKQQKFRRNQITYFVVVYINGKKFEFLNPDGVKNNYPQIAEIMYPPINTMPTQENIDDFLDLIFTDRPPGRNSINDLTKTHKQFFVKGTQNGKQKTGFILNGNVYLWSTDYGRNTNPVDPLITNYIDRRTGVINESNQKIKIDDAPNDKAIVIFDNIVNNLNENALNTRGYDDYIKTFKSVYNVRRFIQYAFEWDGVDYVLTVSKYLSPEKRSILMNLLDERRISLDLTKGAGKILSTIQNSFKESGFDLKREALITRYFPDYENWIQSNFHTHRKLVKGQDVLSFLLKENGSNDFNLSTITGFEDKFTIEQNNNIWDLNIQRPGNVKPIVKSSNEIPNLIPGRYRIDLLVIDSNEKPIIAYEIDGGYHYAETGTLTKNFLNGFLNDQLENYYLKNIAKIDVVRIPYLQTTIKKDKLEKFILDDLQRRLSVYS